MCTCEEFRVRRQDGITEVGSVPTKRVTALGALACVAVLFTASSAGAVPEFSGALDEAAVMPCPAPCTVCHADSTGGPGTVIKPFGLELVDRGLTKDDPDVIASAVRDMRNERIDSDGDGMGDIQELDRGRDPNKPGDESVCGPKYGCGGRIAPAGRFDGFPAIASFVALVLLWSRWRRCRKRR